MIRYTVEYRGLLGNGEWGWFKAFETTSEYIANRRAAAIEREGRQVRVMPTPIAHSIQNSGFVTFATRSEAETYLMALDGFSGNTRKLEGGNWAVSFRRENTRA